MDDNDVLQPSFSADIRKAVVTAVFGTVWGDGLTKLIILATLVTGLTLMVSLAWLSGANMWFDTWPTSAWLAWIACAFFAGMTASIPVLVCLEYKITNRIASRVDQSFMIPRDVLASAEQSQVRLAELASSVLDRVADDGICPVCGSTSELLIEDFFAREAHLMMRSDGVDHMCSLYVLKQACNRILG